MEIAVSTQWLLGSSIVIYLLVMYGISYYAQGQVHNSEDFLVAGRRLPLSLAWMTILATWFGAGTMLAAADEVHAEGLRAAALDPLGAGVCLLLAGFFIAGPIWRLKIMTVPDLFRMRFGPRAELLSSLILIPSYFGWIAAQFTAMAGMLQLFFGMPIEIGLPLVAVIGTGYTFMGGMWSVTLTDAVQITLVLLGLVLLSGVVLWELGTGSMIAGLDTLWTDLPSDRRTIIPTENLVEFFGWMGVFATGALGNLPGQDLMQRVFAAKSAQVASAACLVAGVLYLTFGSLPLMIGLSAFHLLPEETGASILPTLAHAFLHPMVAVVFVIALMSAVLSTIDSAILSPSSVLAHNIAGRWFGAEDALSWNRWAIVFVAVCSLILAFVGESAYSLLEEAYLLTLVGLVVPFTFALMTKPCSSWPGLCSMLTGAGLWLVHFYFGWERFFEPWISENTWPIPMSLSVTGLALLAYLICEPPWRMQRIQPDQH